MWKEKKTQKGLQVLGHVPVRIVNLSLEEVEIGEQTYVGEASPIQVDETQRYEGCETNPVQRDEEATLRKFDDYLRDKLSTSSWGSGIVVVQRE